MASKTMTGYVSNFRCCRDSTAGKLALAMTESRYKQPLKAFDRNIRGDYKLLLDGIKKFTKEQIETSRQVGSDRILIGRLLRLVLKDDSIRDDDQLFINPDGKPSTKAGIRTALGRRERFCFESFILGVWHYAITKRNHAAGKETFNKWCPTGEVERQERVFDEYQFIPINQNYEIYHLPGVREEEASSDGTNDAESQDEAVLPAWYREYRSFCLNYYSKVNVSLFPGQKVPFDKVFVCNDILYGDGGLIADATVKSIGNIYTHTIIIGPGGMGKTMMMKHLFLEAFDHNDRIPVLYNLVNYEGEDIVKCLEDQLEEDAAYFKEGEIEGLLKDGKLIVFLDAFDEITNEEHQKAFRSKIVKFVKRFYGCQIIMSCRELLDVNNFGDFAQMRILPFSRAQICKFINNSGLQKEKQREVLRMPMVQSLLRMNTPAWESRRYRQDIADSTPLILGTVIVVYKENGRVDEQNFYDEAFLVMVEKHDKNKDYQFERRYETELKPMELRACFSDFCYHSYVQGKYNFTRLEVYEFCSDLEVDKEAFLTDLLERACVIVQEGTKFRFLHRNFQQYFAAVYMCSNPATIEQYFAESSPNRYVGAAREGIIEYMYTVNPSITEELVFLPFVNTILQGGYWQFLEMVHDKIEILVSDKNIEQLNSVNYDFGLSGIYFYLSKILDVRIRMQRLFTTEPVEDVGFDEVYFDKEDNTYARKDQIFHRKRMRGGPKDLNPDRFELVGKICFMEPSEILASGRADLIAQMEAPDNDAYMAYEKVKVYYEQLKEKYPGR